MRALLILSFMALAAPAAAQVHPWPGYEAHPAVALERHRAADEAQRARAREQADFARRMQSDSRLTRLELDAARRARPQPIPSPLDRPALPSATTNDATRRSVTEIDAWLDRRPQ